jgi:prepilin-type N-terminal cleavage/methylation domain-containing protein
LGLKLYTAGHGGKQSGYSIIELSIAMAILTSVIAASISGITKLINMNNMNNEIKAVLQVSTGVVGQTLRVPDTSSINTQSMANLQIWPPSKISGSGGSVKIFNEFGGREYLNTIPIAFDKYAPSQTVRYTLTGVPNDDCGRLVPEIESVGVALFVNGDVLSDPGPLGVIPSGSAVIEMPGGSINLSNLSSSCSSAGATKSIDIILARP